MRFPAAILALAGCAISSAWNATGHMVVSAIALADLDPAVRLECERLIQVNKTERAYDFITAGPWADDVRSNENGRWHYINYHFWDDANRPVTAIAEDENVVTAISKFSKVLADRTQSDAARADALRFLIHFVGDIHQPLHSLARDSEQFPNGDRGGNDFKIMPPQSMGEDWRQPPSNLHSLWDSGCALLKPVDRPVTAEGSKLIVDLAAAVTKEYPRRKLPLKTLEPTVWALENVKEARKVYALIEGFEPTSRYMAGGRQLSRKRLAAAGYRLADTLNHLLSPSRPNQD